MNTLSTLWDKCCGEPVGPWDDLWKLAQAGVPADQLNDIGADDITVKHGRWERRFRGDRAFIIPVLADSDGELIDLVAFRLETPRSYWTMTGHSVMLGYENLCRAEYYGEPLMVHESPLEWLRGGREGIVVLNWEHYWPAYFTGLPALQFQNKEFGRRAEAIFQRPIPVPMMLVPAA